MTNKLIPYRIPKKPKYFCVRLFLYLYTTLTLKIIILLHLMVLILQFPHSYIKNATDYFHFLSTIMIDTIILMTLFSDLMHICIIKIMILNTWTFNLKIKLFSFNLTSPLVNRDLNVDVNGSFRKMINN